MLTLCLEYSKDKILLPVNGNTESTFTINKYFYYIFSAKQWNKDGTLESSREA